MKVALKLEELTQLLFSAYLFSLLPFAWWIYPVFILAPDISLIGMLAGKRIGAITYNLIHHKAIGLSAYMIGSLLGIPLLSLVGIVLFGHSSFDRMVGLQLIDVKAQSESDLESIGIRA